MDRQAGYHVKRAQHALRLSMDRSLRDVGLTMAQYALLRALERQPDASNADLARACFVKPQTMIQTLRDLESAGLLSRHRHASDRRVMTTTLTPTGRAQLSAGHGVVDALESRMLRGIPAGEQQRLVRLLELLTANLTEEPSGTDAPAGSRAAEG